MKKVMTLYRGGEAFILAREMLLKDSVLASMTKVVSSAMGKAKHSQQED